MRITVCVGTHIYPRETAMMQRDELKIISPDRNGEIITVDVGSFVAIAREDTHGPRGRGMRTTVNIDSETIVRRDDTLLVDEMVQIEKDIGTGKNADGGELVQLTR